MDHIKIWCTGICFIITKLLFCYISVRHSGLYGKCLFFLQWNKTTLWKYFKHFGMVAEIMEESPKYTGAQMDTHSELVRTTNFIFYVILMLYNLPF